MLRLRLVRSLHPLGNYARSVDMGRTLHRHGHRGAGSRMHIWQRRRELWRSDVHGERSFGSECVGEWQWTTFAHVSEERCGHVLDKEYGGCYGGWEWIGGCDERVEERKYDWDDRSELDDAKWVGCGAEYGAWSEFCGADGDCGYGGGCWRCFGCCACFVMDTLLPLDLAFFSMYISLVVGLKCV